MKFFYHSVDNDGCSTANISIPELLAQITDNDFDDGEFDEVGIILNRFLGNVRPDAQITLLIDLITNTSNKVKVVITYFSVIYNEIDYMNAPCLRVSSDEVEMLCDFALKSIQEIEEKFRNNHK